MARNHGALGNHDHGFGVCDCPKLQVASGMGMAPTGQRMPYMLMVTQSRENLRYLKRLARHAGLRREHLTYARGAMVHLAAATATLAIGPERIGPAPVSPVWTTHARSQGAILLVVGTRLAPNDIEEKVDPLGHLHQTLAGWVPVAGEVGAGRCSASTTIPSALFPPQSGAAGSGWPQEHSW